jgi:class 3 adenylate cyclase
VRELPTGTVTFLFTDIEGSTKLLQELGDGYADVLANHRRLLREVFAAHGGVEVDTQGDAFFVAFAWAAEARAREELALAREIAARQSMVFGLVHFAWIARCAVTSVAPGGSGEPSRPKRRARR